MLRSNMKKNYHFVLFGEALRKNPTSKKGRQKKNVTSPFVIKI
jgi:hypothetical protein